ncbi:DUF1330 domain-containing protein [Epibacterium ulvae]|uniref:DUF1330 domain-containing protein n=1 Tax=Epibacterium ulvae TaxID=1156985 RepID=UPI0024924F3B|nr:DUF1330 domain-containing protein [Epibacterium ulvae]
MTVKVVALTSVNEDNIDALTTYIGVTSPLLERVGARIVERYQIEKTVIGDALPQTVTVVEYPDMAAVERVFEGAEYTGLREVRERAFTHYQISIAR